MAPAPYFQTITSESVWQTHYQNEGGQPFSSLVLASASGWSRKHLLACRVLRREQLRNILPILSPHQPDPETQSPLPDEIRAFLRGPDEGFAMQSEHSLARSSNGGITLGQVWAALAVFKGTQDRRTLGITASEHESDDDGSDSAEPRPKRARINMTRENFVDSGTMRAGSSSSEKESSRATPSVGYIDQDPHILAMEPEDSTLRLLTCVIRHVLYFAKPQDSASAPVVLEYRDSRTRYRAETRTEQQFVAIDDGSICLRHNVPGKGSIIARDHVALVEAKKGFQTSDDGQPTISDDCLAQMVCEALAARLSGHREETVIIVHAIQFYMCFVELQIGDDYLDDLQSGNQAKFLYINATKWFDITQMSGREFILANLCGIMRKAKSDLDQ